MLVVVVVVVVVLVLVVVVVVVVVRLRIVVIVVAVAAVLWSPKNHPKIPFVHSLLEFEGSCRVPVIIRSAVNKRFSL